MNNPLEIPQKKAVMTYIIAGRLWSSMLWCNLSL